MPVGWLTESTVELGNKLVKHATKFLSRQVLERDAYIFNLNNLLHITKKYLEHLVLHTDPRPAYLQSSDICTS